MILFVSLFTSTPSSPAQDSAPLSVRVEVPGDSCYVGEAVDLAVGVTARDERPRLELPALANADLWALDTAFRPISASGIGDRLTGENVFLTRLRLVPRRAGTLMIPPVVARLDGRSGRSKAVRIEVEPVPLEGRPAEFLGGVGGFSIRSEAAPGTVQVGQEVTFRLVIEGPAALGMTERPDLGRFAQVPLALRVTPMPVEFNREPPSRAFAYRLRPTRAGSATLPPVAVAAFDPRLGRYITKVSPGRPISAVAVAAFDPRTVRYAAPEGGAGGIVASPWARAAVVLVGLAVAAALMVLARRRRWFSPRTGPRAARRFARRAARRFRPSPRSDAPDEPREELARRIVEALTAYAEIGAGRPPGALTPAEASSVVDRLTGSDELAARCAELVARCDRTRFAADDGDAAGRDLGNEAQALFEALGRAAMRGRAG